MIKGEEEALNPEHMGHYRKRQLEPQGPRGGCEENPVG